MNTETDGREFWALLDRLVEKSVVVIDRPRGSRHPRYPDCVYPLDYGFLKDTASMDGGRHRRVARECSKYGHYCRNMHRGYYETRF